MKYKQVFRGFENILGFSEVAWELAEYAVGSERSPAPTSCSGKLPGNMLPHVTQQAPRATPSAVCISMYPDWTPVGNMEMNAGPSTVPYYPCHDVAVVAAWEIKWSRVVKNFTWDCQGKPGEVREFKNKIIC